MPVSELDLRPSRSPRARGGGGWLHGEAPAALANGFQEEGQEEEPRLSASEPEMEDEAQGWEIVEIAPRRGGGARLPSRADEQAYLVERPQISADDAPEHLIFGCMDSHCETRFRQISERYRCVTCKLPFCGKHSRNLPVAAPRSRCSSTVGDIHPERPSGVPLDRQMSAAGSWLALAEWMGLPTAGEPATFCNACYQVVIAALTPIQLALGPPSPGLPLPPPQYTLDVRAVAMEAMDLRLAHLADIAAAVLQAEAEEKFKDAQPAAEADEEGEEGEADGKAKEERAVGGEKAPERLRRGVAARLLTRGLGRLKVCLRSWTEYEREWLWRIREELVDLDVGSAWVAQFVRQTRWDQKEEAVGVRNLVERVHARKSLEPRDAVQILSALGRHAVAAEASLQARGLGLVATHACDTLGRLPPTELACCLELLLDAGHALGAAGATGGRRAVVGALVQAALGTCPAATALRGELFWSLEARSKTASAARASALPVPLPMLGGGGGPPQEDETWAARALQDLLSRLPADERLALLEQRSWVRHLENGETDAARCEVWGDADRAFPLAVWPPERLCLGMSDHPRMKKSKTAPVTIRCRWRAAEQWSNGAGEASPAVPPQQPVGGTGADPPPPLGSGVAAAGHPPPPVTTGSGAGLLLKRDAGMPLEQQVGQTLRLLESLIWQEDEKIRGAPQTAQNETLRSILARQGLKPEDVRVTYSIAMTGPSTAIVEFVEGAKTLRDVREGSGKQGSIRERFLAPADRCTLLAYLRQHNASKEAMATALSKLAFTSALSAVLAFVAGLGDRHHENFMATSDGRLLHVDYGYALGREPFDSMLIHFVSGGRPPTLLQYEELMEALSPDLLKRLFWPTVIRAYNCVRKHSGLFAEMVFAAVARDHCVRDPRAKAWSKAQEFVAGRCVPTMADASAEQFVQALFNHCARHEDGSRLRDKLKGLNFRERASEALQVGLETCKGPMSAAGQAATAAVGGAAPRILEGVAVARGLLGTVRGLLAETGATQDDDDE